MSVESGLAEYREEYEAFVRTGGTNPTWYQRYSTVTLYLAHVRQRLGSRPDAVWTVEETPMLIWVFAHIVRGAILAWWRQLPR